MLTSTESLRVKVDNVCRIKGSLLTPRLGETNGFKIVNLSPMRVWMYFHQSGLLTKKGRLSKKGNVHIRQALYMPALNAAHRNKGLCHYYKRLNARQQAKKQGICPENYLREKRTTL